MREFFGDDRLQHLLSLTPEFDDLMKALTRFCEGVPLADDCTLVQLTYKG